MNNIKIYNSINEFKKNYGIVESDKEEYSRTKLNATHGVSAGIIFKDSKGTILCKHPGLLKYSAGLTINGSSSRNEDGTHMMNLQIPLATVSFDELNTLEEMFSYFNFVPDTMFIKNPHDRSHIRDFPQFSKTESSLNLIDRIRDGEQLMKFVLSDDELDSCDLSNNYRTEVQKILRYNN